MKRLQDLVNDLVENIAAQTEAIRQGKTGGGDKHGKRYVRAFQELLRAGDSGRDALVPLLRHPRKRSRNRTFHKGVGFASLICQEVGHGREEAEREAA
jgi:hypothetical protein